MTDFSGSFDQHLAASVENYYAGRFEEEQCGCGAVLDGREAEKGLCRKCQEDLQENS